MIRLCILTISMSWAPFFVASAEELPDIPSPHALYHAEVLRIVDGDTIDVRVDLWPGLAATYAVRVRGIDAPEVHRAECDAERAWGEEAKAQVEKLYVVGSLVRLENVERDPFFGRVVADVRRWRSDRWLYLADELVERGLADAWTPDMPDIDWCLLANTR